MQRLNTSNTFCWMKYCFWKIGCIKGYRSYQYRESGYYLLCMVCGGSGRSNESTTDTLRNQGTKSQGRFFQREKELIFHFFETLPLDFNVPFDGATRSLGGILEESWVQYFSVNWPGLHVNYF